LKKDQFCSGNKEMIELIWYIDSLLEKQELNKLQSQSSFSLNNSSQAANNEIQSNISIKNSITNSKVNK
jgi:hypothetical protein